MAALVLTGAVIRSPRDQANQIKKIPAPKKVAPTNTVLMPPVPTAAPLVIVRPPWFGPYHITLAWQSSPGFTYSLHVRSNMLPSFYTNILTTNTWATVSNLWHPGFYEFAVSIVATDGWESQMSPVVRWPQPRTNFISMGVSARTNDNWETNSTYIADLPTAFYRLQSNAGMYSLQSSPNFKQWTTDTNWPTQNPLPTFYLRDQRWDNVTGIEHRD
jgi:hypothetical protein